MIAHTHTHTLTHTHTHIFIQGGPGGSSTGFGNFQEIGPFDVTLSPRSTTWVRAANVLFVDNPVGTGYSYVDEDSAYTTNVDEIAQDLLTLFGDFLKGHTVFQVAVHAHSIITSNTTFTMSS